MTFIRNTFKGEVGKLKELANTKKSKGCRNSPEHSDRGGSGPRHLSLAPSAKPNCRGKLHGAECEAGSKECEGPCCCPESSL